MAISLRAAGTHTGSATLVTAINPAVPAGTTTGDLSVLVVTVKPFDTVLTTPSGWTKLGEATNGTVVAGTDTGSTKVAMYVRESAPVGAIGNIGQTGANSMGAVIHSYQKGAGESWDYEHTFGIDDTNAANYSATSTGTMVSQTGDIVLVGTSVNADLGVDSNHNLAATGHTFGAAVVRTTQIITIGLDSRTIFTEFPVTTGTASSVAHSYAYFNTSATSGTSYFLRLRGVPTPGEAWNGTATYTGSGTLVASGVPALTRAVGLSGGSTGGATRTPAMSVATALTGTGTLSPTGLPALAATKALSGSGTLSPAGAPAFAAPVPLSGSGTLVVSGKAGFTFASALSASGALTTVRTFGVLVDSAVSGTGTLSASGTPAIEADAEPGAVGTLGVSAAVSISATATFTGTGTLSAHKVTSGTIYTWYWDGSIKRPATILGVWDGEGIVPASIIGIT